MTRAPSFDDLFQAIAAASVGETDKRIDVSGPLDPNDPATRLAVALNLLLDDLDYRNAESKARYEALQQTEAQLRQSQKMECVGRLAGGIAHDFNNILSVILSYGEFLQQRFTVTAPEHQEVSEIIKAGMRAATLTRQLLTFSRQQLTEPRIVDLNELLRGMTSMLARLVGEDIELRHVLTENLGLVNADFGCLEQVIMNLVVNSRDAMPNGGTIRIETYNIDLTDRDAQRVDSVPGAHVALLVKDTGVGFNEETRIRLFEPFFTTKEPGKGTGLGLSVVYGIVKQAGGFITVQSEVGAGTSFEVVLPRAMEGRADPVGLSVEVVAGGSETILVAEDDEQVRTVAATILRGAGYRVLEAKRAEEALLVARQHQGAIDLLLTDIVMPGLDGRELAQLIREARPTLRILFMSGYVHDILTGMNSGNLGAPWLQKPLTPKLLLRKVRDVLEQRRKVGYT